MRIQSVNQVSQIYQANATTKRSKVTSTRKTDELEISSIGKDYQAAKAAVAATSDVREDKVAELKSKIAAGTYEVSGEDFASKLIASYKEKNRL